MVSLYMNEGLSMQSACGLHVYPASHHIQCFCCCVCGNKSFTVNNNNESFCVSPQICHVGAECTVSKIKPLLFIFNKSTFREKKYIEIYTTWFQIKHFSMLCTFVCLFICSSFNLTIAKQSQITLMEATVRQFSHITDKTTL